MVGSPQDIDCIVNTTIPGVSSVSVSWTGPGGVLIMNNTNRVTISPTTSSGNIFTSSLQFDYLMEGDEGNYTCNVMILDANTNQSIELQSLNGKYFVSYKLLNIHNYLKLLFLFLTNNFVKFNTCKILNSCILFFTYSLNGRHYTLHLKLVVTNNSNF